MRVLGIDVGLSGALAVIDGNANRGILGIIDMPTTGEDTQRRVHARAVASFIREHKPERAFIERVTAMPSIPDPNDPNLIRRSMGAASAFRFGDSCGTVRTCVILCEVPFTYVVPQRWKRLLGLKGSNKEDSRQKALALFPDAAHFMARKKDENRAEATLIALYGLKEATNDWGEDSR